MHVVGAFVEADRSPSRVAEALARDLDTMAHWLMHPQAMVPGAAMPEMGLSAAQAKTISDYLYTLDKR